MIVLPSSAFADGISLINVNINVPVTIDVGGVVKAVFTPSPNPGVLNPPAFITFSETPRHADLTVTGGDFDSDSQTGGVIIGDFWTATFTISQDAGFINDVLSLNGTFKHLIEPDEGERPIPAAPIFTFNYVLNADSAVNGIASSSQSFSGVHGSLGHTDVYNSKLTATVTSVGPFDDITGYTFVVTADHVPEPSALILSGSGMAGLVGFLRLRNRNSETKPLKSV